MKGRPMRVELPGYSLAISLDMAANIRWENLHWFWF